VPLLRRKPFRGGRREAWRTKAIRTVHSRAAHGVDHAEVAIAGPPQRVGNRFALRADTGVRPDAQMDALMPYVSAHRRALPTLGGMSGRLRRTTRAMV
jgi:hypothetical protein